MKKLWIKWEQSLQHWKLREPLLFVLEALGPFSEILAQLVYVGQPVFGRILTQEDWNAFTTILEDREERDSFINFLREESVEL